MTRRYVTDEQNRRLWRRFGEIARRVDEGTIPFDTTMQGLQALVEGQKTPQDLFGSIVKLTLDDYKRNNVYPVTVNYDQSLEDMIAAGHYDGTNPDIISKNFPIKEKGVAQVAIQLIHFNKSMSFENALVELDKYGFRPATLPELLAFSAAYSEMQRQFPVVALGSVWRGLGGRRVPDLWGDAGARGLDLDWFEDDWHGHCRFAAVSK